MATKPAKRNWNDVQTAIATATIVTTLGMWNLFAAPAKAEGAETVPPEGTPTLPPTASPTPKPPFEAPVMPTKVKVMFTQIATPDTTIVQQSPQEKKKKKKKKRDNGGSTASDSGGGGGGGAPVANTGSS
jgi:hypothetical protein